MASDERDVRIAKIDKIRETGINPYVGKFERTALIEKIRELPIGTKDISAAGRLILHRSFGSLIFATIQDWTGKIQIALNKKSISVEEFKFFEKMVDVGDFVGVNGELYRTDKGELTISVASYKLLSKAIRPLPEKFHGLTDLEARSRQRYLDLIVNSETRELFKKRIKVINTIRNFLNDNDFLEVETPVLQTKPSGALAKPFQTHHNALDIDMFLRISPETYLKRCIAGGMDRVYEFSRCFRNEGMDPSHLQDFTLLEFYASYWNYIDNMDFTEKLIKHLLMEVNGSLTLKYGDNTINFDGEWPRYSFRELLIKHVDIDIDKYPTKDELVASIKSKGIELDVDFAKIGRGNLIDQLYKKVARPSMIAPQFLIHHPIDLSPLARKNDDDPMITDRFQLVVNTWEVVNAYSELVDPIDQRERLLKQATAREGGDEEAMIMEEDFVLCMEYGMPPISGWGMGIDRFVALLTNQENLREVVLFPLMKPLDSDKKDDKSENIGTNSEICQPLSIDDLGVSNDKLDAIFSDKVKKDTLISHSIATAQIMKKIANKFGLNENSFYYIGLLHDIDLSETENDMPNHAKLAEKWLKEAGMNETAAKAIASHNFEMNGTERSNFIDYALIAAETISGLISATARVYPDKKVASVKPSSVIKRMKEKAFAANVNRDSILLCEKIGLSLEDFTVLAIDAMKEVADKIGL